MIAVVVEWNTDENSLWINEADRLDIPGEEYLTYPLSVIGPFDTDEDARLWMEGALEDNADVFDMFSVDREFPKGDYPTGWFIANPKEYPDGYHRPEGQHPDAILEVVIEAPMPIPRPEKKED